jgi:hypothetical protein
MGFIAGMIVGGAVLIISEILGFGLVAGIVKWF